MKTKVFHGDSISNIDSQLDQYITPDFAPTLAIVFSSVEIDYNAVCKSLDSRGIVVYGATTAGEIANDEVIEAACSVMLMELDKSGFRIDVISTEDRDTYSISQELAKKATESFSNPAILVTFSGLTTDGEEVVRGITNTIGHNVPIFGGMAGDDFKMNETFVFSNRTSSNDGIIGLTLDGDKFSVVGLAASGWKGVGVEKTITKAKGNVVYTIDDEPAIDVFIKYFGLREDLGKNPSDVVDSIGVQYPLQLDRGENEPVLRAALMGNPEDGSLIFGGTVPQGAKVKFSVPPNFDIVNQVIDETRLLKQHAPEADALVLFSCKARHLALGPMIEEEVEGIRSVWGAPLVGFFTYGEIGNLKGSGTDYHNETCSLVVLKEN